MRKKINDFRHKLQYCWSEVRENCEVHNLPTPRRLLVTHPIMLAKLMKHEMDEHTELVNHLNDIQRKRDLGVLTCIMQSVSPCEGDVKEWSKPPEDGKYGLSMALCTKHAVEFNTVDGGFTRKDEPL